MDAKIFNPSDDQPLIIISSDPNTGADISTVMLEPGMQATVDLHAGCHVTLRAGPATVNPGDERPVTTRATLVEDPRKMGDESGAGIKVASTDDILATMKEHTDAGGPLTGDGKMSVAELNAKLAEKGFAPVTAAQRDEAAATAV